MNEGPDSPVSSSGLWLSRYEAWAEWPLVVLAAGFLVAYALPILDRQLPHDVAHLLGIFNVAVWAVFAADYLARLAGTSDRIRFIRATWLDLAAVVLPMLRPLRALRLIRVIRVLDRKAAMGLRGRTAIYVCATTALAVFSASLAILDAERDNPDATIRDFTDALWWAVTTITTVGYGDRYQSPHRAKSSPAHSCSVESPCSASSPPPSHRGSSNVSARLNKPRLSLNPSSTCCWRRSATSKLACPRTMTATREPWHPASNSRQSSHRHCLGYRAIHIVQ